MLVWRSEQLALVLTTAALACTPRPSASLTTPSPERPATTPATATTTTVAPEASRSRWIDVAVASEHGCAVERTGAVYCWGRDPAAEMRLRELPPQPQAATPSLGARPWGPPSRVEGIDDARAVSTAGNLACAVVEDGQVRCWGSFAWGTAHLFDVPGIRGAVDVEIGLDESCARLGSGELWCWSAAGHGVPRLRQDQVVALDVADALACGLDQQGEIRCWGQSVVDWYGYDARFNQPAPPAGTPEPSPEDLPDTIEVGRFRGAVDLALTEWNRLCVLRSDGKVVCSEQDLFALLRGEPLTMLDVPLPPGEAIVELHATTSHVCGRTQTGGALCWGRNVYGQLGDGTSESRTHAEPVEGLTGVIDLDVTEDLSCATTEVDTIACWGFDRGEVLGREGVHVHTLAGLRARSLVAAGRTTCANDDQQQLRCWGAESIEGLGVVAAATARLVALDGSTTDLVGMMGSWDTCLLHADGALRCGSWALSGSGPRQLLTSVDLSGVEAVSGPSPSCVITRAGAQPELACGSAISAREPITALRRPSAVASGNMRACVIHDGGKVSCFAELYYWGDGPPPVREIVPVPGIRDAVALTSAMYHDCALGQDGRVRCWVGRSETQWSEDGRTATAAHYRLSGLDDVGLTGVVDLVAGLQHHCALGSDGGVRCWDDSPYGDGRTWLPVPELPADIVELAAGSEHTCARAKSGSVTCWGEDVSGQLGRVPSRVHLTPTTLPLD